jgi:hypothetical protein
MAACGPRSLTLMVVSAMYVGTVALIMPMPNPHSTRAAHYPRGQLDQTAARCRSMYTYNLTHGVRRGLNGPTNHHKYIATQDAPSPSEMETEVGAYKSDSHDQASETRRGVSRCAKSFDTHPDLRVRRRNHGNQERTSSQVVVCDVERIEERCCALDASENTSVVAEDHEGHGAAERHQSVYRPALKGSHHSWEAHIGDE